MSWSPFYKTDTLAVLIALLVAAIAALPIAVSDATDLKVVEEVKFGRIASDGFIRADNVIDYTCNMNYYWKMPVGGIGCEILGMRFTNPYPCPCTLTNVEISLYNSSIETTDTTGDLEITIYEVVDDWPPYVEISSVVVPNEDLVGGWGGSPLNAVNVPIDRIIIAGDAEWVVGVGTATAGEGDTLLLLSDDGSCPKQRSVCWNPYFWTWQDLWAEWGIDVNFHISSTIEVGCLVGDWDYSGGIDIDDLVQILAYLFSGPPPLHFFSGDANCDCVIDIDDPVYLVDFIFSQGPAPCSLDEWEIECGGLW